MSSQPEPIYELKCSCNQYPWGKQGSNSLSARLCAKQPGWDGDGPKENFEINESNSYAEMWMGTYPVLPSYIASTGEDLQDVLDRYPNDLIGERTMQKFGHSKLPYLPKVLSIAKALPLQLHPNKDLATKLHKQKPDAFTDPNHKPEIALALSEFEAFCGFKPLDNIAQLMQIDPLKRFLPPDAETGFTNEHLRGVVRSMLLADDALIQEVYQGLISVSPDRYKKMADASHVPKLAQRLASQYSKADPGILVALVTMNYLVLQPGESIYIPADGIHAYLSGDIIECMARSNNVLNTGFCPRAERSNVDIFCSTLTFTPHSSTDSLLQPRPYAGSQTGRTTVYAPPMSEFDMLQTRLKAGEGEVLRGAAGPGVLLVTHGGAQMKANGKECELREGQVLFVAHDVELQIEAGSDGLLMHTAVVN